MAKSDKIYKIKKTSFGRGHEGKESIVEGTLTELIKHHSYTLEIGNSWNSKIDRNPKTIKSFMRNLTMSYEEKEGACYTRTLLELVE